MSADPRPPASDAPAPPRELPSHIGDLMPRFRRWANRLRGRYGVPIYLVGSALREDNPDPRDWDIRMMLPDDDFALRFGPVEEWRVEGSTGVWTRTRFRWSDQCVKDTKDAVAWLHLNVDFQIYPESHAAAMYGDQPRLRIDSFPDDASPASPAQEATPPLSTATDAQLAASFDAGLADLALAERYEHNAHLVGPIRAWLDRIRAEQASRAAPTPEASGAPEPDAAKTIGRDDPRWAEVARRFAAQTEDRLAELSLRMPDGEFDDDDLRLVEDARFALTQLLDLLTEPTAEATGAPEPDWIGCDPMENGYDPAAVERLYRARVRSLMAEVATLEARLHELTGDYGLLLDRANASAARLHDAERDSHRGCFCLHCNPPLPGEAPSIQRVQQEDPKGCAVACLAMVSGRTYAEVRSTVNPAQVQHGLADQTVVWWLNRYGLWHRRWWMDGEWGRPAPTSGVAIMLTHDAHWVVLVDGVVLDPARPDPLASYDFRQAIEVRPERVSVLAVDPSWSTTNAVAVSTYALARATPPAAPAP